MDLHLLVSSPLHSIIIIIIIFFILILVPSSYSQDNEQYMNCTQPYQCGNINVGYPFWGENRPNFCGHEGFELSCVGNSYSVLDIAGMKFGVLEINQSLLTMTIARMDLWDNVCGAESFSHTTSNNNLFNYSATNQDLYLFYNCSSEDQIPVPYINCPINGAFGDTIYYVNDSLLAIHGEQLLDECNKPIIVPVLNSSLDQLWNQSLTLQDALDRGFDVEYDSIGIQCVPCENSKGFCLYNSTFLCLCGNTTQPQFCPKHGRMNWEIKLGIALGSCFVGILLSCIIFYIRLRRRKKLRAPSTLLSRDISSGPSSKMDLERQDNLFGAHLFSYSELEAATNNFDSNKELGDGGFGTVYYGKLQDGRAVAVKRLYENNYKRVEQFKNEVEILTRLRHQNLVSLYGCTSRHSRELLLVYEYIPNGTVADHLHGERAKPGALPWPIRLKIAIETASALTYLHASDIIHRDVKTNNILLDNNFCVKVADFGLSRLFPTDVTHVSTAPQGTPGYVDPEYHQCYQLTDKSDVFSFGVVLIELISSKPAVDITRHRHEINLSTMAINKIQNRELHELVDPSLGFGSDYKVRNMITDVSELAFRCLQQGKDMRPSMEQVLEALKGIQSEDYNRAKEEEIDIPSDDTVLLKSGQLTLSPVSVTTTWISDSTMPSISTTPIASG